MDFSTTKQYSSIWNISQRRITKLCEQDRIKGAVKIGGIWLIPPHLDRPKDKRIKSGKYIKFRSDL